MTPTEISMAKAKENQKKRDSAKQSKIKRDKAKARKEKAVQRKSQSKKKKAAEARKEKAVQRKSQSKKKKAAEARKEKAAQRKSQSKKKKAAEARRVRSLKKTKKCKLCGSSCELGMFAINACVCRRSNCKGYNVTPSQVTMYRRNNNQPVDMTDTQVAMRRARLNRANRNRNLVNMSPMNAPDAGIFAPPVVGSFGGPAPPVVGGFGAPRGGIFIAPEVSPTREQLLSGDYDVEWSPPSRRDKVMLQEVTVRKELDKQDKEEEKKSKKVYDSAPKKIKDLFDRLKKNIKKVDKKNAEAKSIINKTERLDVNSSEFHRLDRRRFELYDEIKVIVHENDELSAALKKENYKYYWGNLLYGV